MRAEYQGIVDDMLRLVEKKQLKDRSLWKLVSGQFAKTPDDADHGWRGEYWGKLMRGACMTWQYTRDEELYEILTETVRDLLSCQEEDGRISTYSRKEEFHGWDLWCRKYVLLGLIHFYEICRDEAFRRQVLEAAGRHLDHIIRHIGKEQGKLSITQASDNWLGINSSSILEPVVRLYLLKPEKRYLDFADYIVENGGAEGFPIFEAAYEDQLSPYEYPVTKAYELMSCFEGLLFYAEVRKSEKWRQAVVRFADRLLETEATVVGGSGCQHELFNHSALMQSGTKYDGLMLETCVTVTWMKLMERVYRLTGEMKYLEEAERSAFNALYGAVNTENAACGPEAVFDEPYYREVYDRATGRPVGQEAALAAGRPAAGGPAGNNDGQAGNNGGQGQMFDSYSPLMSGIRGRAVGGFKSMEENTAYCGCCIAIGAAGCALATLMAARDTREGVEIDLCLPGTIRTEVHGIPVELKVKSPYPKPGEILLSVKAEKETEWELRLRIPSFVEEGSMQINEEEPEKIPDQVRPGSFAAIKRLWRTGDAVRLSLSWGLRYVHGMENPEDEDSARQTAVLYGPLTLARDRRLEKGAPEDIPCQCRMEVPFGGKEIPMIDYASAGKTWRQDSRMAVWVTEPGFAGTSGCSDDACFPEEG